MFAAILLSFFVVLILYYSQYRKKWRQKYGQLDALPGPRTYPIIGNMWRIILVSRLKRIEHQAGMLNKYGTLFKMWVGNKPVVICASAEDAELILSSRVNLEKSFAYDFMKPWLGTGVLISTGAKWRQLRKWHKLIIDYSTLDSTLPSIVKHSRTFLEKLKSLENSENEWNIIPFVRNYALDLVCDVFMGVDMDVQNDDKAPEFFRRINDMCAIVTEKAVLPWWHVDWLYARSNLYEKEMQSLRVLRNMSTNIIQRKKQKRERENLRSVDSGNDDDDTKSRKKSYLDLLLDMNDTAPEGDRLTNEDIRVEVDNFLFGGQDSTSSGISSTIHFLSRHPEIQNRVARELFDVFGNSDRDPTLRDMSKLKYLECVIKESHRLLPPVPHVSRTLSEALTLGGKYRIPAGTAVQVNIFAIHHQEKHFQNPQKFDPNNFAPENCRRRHSYAYLPFSAGPRNCLGQKFAMLEEKILLSSLLRKYEIESSQKTEELGLYVALTIRHANGVKVRLRPRTRGLMISSICR